MIRSVLAALATAIVPAVAGAPPLAAAPPVDRIDLPDGYRAELYAEVEGARSLLVVDALDAVFVSTRGDSVFAVIDANRDRRADRVVRVLDGLKVANGIAWNDGHLYVAEQHRIVRFAAPDLDTLGRAEPEVIFDGLPDKSHHGWRYAGFGPGGWLYVAVGAPCNICRVSGLEATIVRLRPEPGAKPEIFAHGVRNSVGFDFHPETGEMFFTDNGADWMGDDRPPDELNHAPRPGMHFGYPWYGGGADRTGAFRNRPLPGTVTPPVVAFNAHVAALGVHFYRGALFPDDVRGDAFVAQHGSWNRSIPDGYRVMRVRFDGGRAVSHEVFADGFLSGRRAWGRPVDVAELADGSLLVSDDRADAVYRITYNGP